MTEYVKMILTREFNGLKEQIERKRVTIANEEERLKKVKEGYEFDINALQELHRDLELDGVLLENNVKEPNE